jgi:thiamine biosynthesis lipoprotein
MPSRSNSGVRRARPLLGTIVEIALPEDDEDSFAAIDAAFQVVEEVQRRMSFHEAESTLSRVNREAASTPVAVDAWTFAVLQTAAELHRESGGLFDVAVAPQLQELGYLPGSRRLGAEGTFADVELSATESGGTVRFHQPGLALDLGGIAKGFAVDCAVESLRAAGVEGGLVNAGGDLHAFGEAPFPVAIRDPGNPGTTLLTLHLRDAGLATSAHYFADRLAPSANQPPIIFPSARLQPPVTSLPRSVTVHARSAMLADALTKVVMLDPAAAQAVLRRHGAAALLVSTDGAVMCTEDWNATLHVSS